MYLRKWLAPYVLAPLLLHGDTRALINSQSDEVRQLAPGASVERELGAGQTHSYQITLAAEQYLRITVDQRGLDVAVTLFGPDGRAEAESDYDADTNGQEILSLASRTAGASRLAVSSKSKLAGRYTLKVVELRAATPQDAARSAAYRLLMEARRLQSQKTAEAMKQAAGKFDEALAAWKALGDQDGEAATLASAGQLYFDLADAKKTLDAWTQALAIWRSLGRRGQEAQALSNLGMLNYARGARDQALSQYDQALPLHRAEDDKYWEAETLNRLGWVYNSMDERRKAIEYFNLALPLRRVVGDRSGEAVTLNDLGRAHDLLGDKRQAIEFLEQALRLNPPDENPDGAANTLIRLGVVYESTGESQKAIDAYGQALSLLERVNNRRALASALNNVGLAYANLGDYGRAIEYYDRSLKLSRELGLRGGEATTLHNIGMVYRAAHETQKAIDYHNQALAIYKSANNRGGQAMVLQALGVAHYETGESRRALELFEQALDLRRATGDRRGEALTLTSLGVALTTLGEAQKAHDHLSQAQPLHRLVSNPEGEAQTLIGLAQVKYDLGAAAEARALIDQSLRLTESIRAKAPGQELRASYFATVQRRYDQGIDLLMRMGETAAALQVSEMARARSLLELLTEAGAGVRRGVAPELLARERAIRQSLNARAEAQARLLDGKHTEAQAAAMARDIAALSAQLKDVETEIRRSSPHYAALTQPEPLTVAQIQKQLLDDDTLLLEYSLGEKNSYLWLVSPASVTGYRLPSRADIEAASRQVYDLLITRPRRRDPVEPQFIAQAEALSRMLLGPVASQLGAKRLVIVAPGIMSYLPFAALPAPGGENQSSGIYQPLIAKREIVTLPSASVLSVIRREMAGRRPAAKSVAVLADPVFEANDSRLALAKNKSASGESQNATTTPSTVIGIPSALTRAVNAMNASNTRTGFTRLAFSRQEAESILALASDGTGLKATDFNASRSLVMSEALSQYRVLHLATHGLLNSQYPELSGIVFSLIDREGKSQDGFLRLHDIYNLQFNADLIVLSACETGLGKEIKGEGLIGLTRGFMYAGAPRVVASLWNVDDLATAELMKVFYRGMLKDGLRPAAALRAAQFELSKQKRWASPYFWAGFMLQGEWQ